MSGIALSVSVESAKRINRTSFLAIKWIAAHGQPKPGSVTHALTSHKNGAMIVRFWRTRTPHKHTYDDGGRAGSDNRHIVRLPYVGVDAGFSRAAVLATEGPKISSFMLPTISFTSVLRSTAGPALLAGLYSTKRGIPRRSQAKRKAHGSGTGADGSLESFFCMSMKSAGGLGASGQLLDSLSRRSSSYSQSELLPGPRMIGKSSYFTPKQVYMCDWHDYPKIMPRSTRC